VDVLLERWQAEGLSAGTLKNRLAHLRWWAEKVGKAGVIPADNAQLGIPKRHFVADENKARELGDRLDRIRDAHVRMSLSLQEAFGLRREECIKFQPRYADRGDCIVLKDSWAKGGRPRTVPITTPEQRTVLDAVGSLIPPHKNFIQQRRTYDGQCKAAGLSRMHGLRHRYEQMRYEALTGWKAPAGELRAQRVTDLLKRPIYAGYVEAPDWAVPLRKGYHEPLISFETFRTIQDRLAGNAKTPARKDLSADFPLRGAVVCGHCGTPLTACWTKGKYSRYPYYLCPKRGVRATANPSAVRPSRTSSRRCSIGCGRRLSCSMRRGPCSRTSGTSGLRRRRPTEPA
jgi:hypothetical protein